MRAEIPGLTEDIVFKVRAMRFLLTLIIVWSMVPPGVASAGSYASAQMLHERCQQPSSQSAVDACYFYSLAIADVLDTTVINNFRACIPTEVKAEQVRDVVKKWLEDHPELRHYAAAGVVAEGLSKAFPC